MPNVSVPIALQRRDEIIERIRQGEQVASIANSLGVHRSTINRYLAQDQEYQDAQIEHHAARLDQAEQMILTADDAPSCTRARNYWASVAWRAEREQRRIWGQQDDRGSGGVTIVINTQDSRGVLIQGEGGDHRAGGGELTGASSCMPSSTDNKVIIQDSSSTETDSK